MLYFSVDRLSVPIANGSPCCSPTTIECGTCETRCFTHLVTDYANYLYSLWFSACVTNHLMSVSTILTNVITFGQTGVYLVSLPPYIYIIYHCNQYVKRLFTYFFIFFITPQLHPDLSTHLD